MFSLPNSDSSSNCCVFIFPTIWSSLFSEQIFRSLDVLYIVDSSFLFSVYLSAFWNSLHDIHYFICPVGMVIRDTKTAMYISVPARGPDIRIRSEHCLAYNLRESLRITLSLNCHWRVRAMTLHEFMLFCLPKCANRSCVACKNSWYSHKKFFSYLWTHCKRFMLLSKQFCNMLVQKFRAFSDSTFKNNLKLNHPI